MDIQFISNKHAAAAYVTGYMTKGETAGLRQLVSEALQALPEDCSTAKCLMKIGSTILTNREMSLQEATYHLTGLPLRGSSRATIKINIGYPEKRVRILNTGVLRRAAAWGDEEQQENGGQEEIGAMACGLAQYYAARPDTDMFNNLNLLQFAIHWSWS